MNDYKAAESERIRQETIEECAKVCEEYAKYSRDNIHSEGYHSAAAHNLAYRIRSLPSQSQPDPLQLLADEAQELGMGYGGQPQQEAPIDERAAFENWHSNRYQHHLKSYVYCKTNSGAYAVNETNKEYAAWQARANLAAPAIPTEDATVRNCVEMLNNQKGLLDEQHIRIRALEQAGFDLTARLCAIGTVGEIDGHEVIRRESVMEFVSRYRAQCDAAAAPIPADQEEANRG